MAKTIKSDRFDYDPEDDTLTGEEAAEASRLLGMAAAEGLAENSDAVDSTYDKEHDWQSLLTGYALGKGATLRVAAEVGYKWNELFR